MRRQSLIVEFWEFVKVRKRYWLFPMIIILSLMGVLIFFA
jgi:hypothetical protein